MPGNTFNPGPNERPTSLRPSMLRFEFWLLRHATTLLIVAGSIAFGVLTVAYFYFG